jgi:hypothetical protein
MHLTRMGVGELLYLVLYLLALHLQLLTQRLALNIGQEQPRKQLLHARLALQLLPLQVVVVGAQLLVFQVRGRSLLFVLFHEHVHLRRIVEPLGAWSLL